MNENQAVQSRISARDRAQQLMNRLTAGIAVMAVAGVGVLGYVSAQTIPGSTTKAGSTSATTSASSGSSTSSTSSSSSTSSTSSSSTGSSGLQSSSGSISSSSGSGVAVSGGS